MHSFYCILICITSRLFDVFSVIFTLSRSAKPVVIPYIIRASHNLKRVGNKYGVPLVFSAPCKLAKMCPNVSRCGPVSSGCRTKHTKAYVRCATCVVYKIILKVAKYMSGRVAAV